MIIRRVLVVNLFLASAAGPAIADCTAFGGYMTGTQIATLLTPGNTFPSGVYACYKSGGVRQNNEYIFAHGPNGAVWDYKKGPSNPTDPSGPVGTYTGGVTTIGGNSNVGTMTYTYGSTSYTYAICVTPSGTTYQFYNIAANTNLSIVVSTSNNGC